MLAHLSRHIEPGARNIAATCSVCPALKLNVCQGMSSCGDVLPGLPNAIPLASPVYRCPPRRVICHARDTSEFVPIICSGWAASSVNLSDGRRQIVSFLLSGDPISIGSLLTPTYGRFVESITEVTYRKFRRNEFWAVLTQKPELLESMSRYWLEERERSDQLAVDLGRRSAEARIARLILTFVERLKSRGLNQGHNIEFPLRQKHIADATGLTAVHVCKVLGEFQRSQLIEITDRWLALVDIDGLRRTAEWT